MSSSICAPCGTAESQARIAAEAEARYDYESSPFGQFMGMSEEDRWRLVFDRLESLEAAQ
ncbi:hypothetical protein B5M44_04280 [Shinella sumterensis]|uniref:hypothetical protein n=1 Tax=Shinella sumterensis TaxID=1967501 RepID=UPI00106E7508|nr:hypothetical protein [Shinella sumterensis]MCD1264041.1 hypothetical protein [Shinella sumterensis]TFE99423.1 hypothetical protein B5M44_04280 [Shinella sumterensis]